MDRNQVIGIIVIAGILIGWLYLTQPSTKDIEAARRKNDSIAKIEKQKELAKVAEDARKKKSIDSANPKLKSDSTLSDSAKVRLLKNQLGDFAAAGKGKQKFVTIENNKIRVKLSSLGGRIYSAEVKDYKTHSRKPLILFNGDDNVFGLDFYTQNKTISTNQLYFVPQTIDSTFVVNVEKKTVKMRLYAGSDKYIEYEYTLEPDTYLLKFNINFVNVNNTIAQNSNLIDLNWEVKQPHLERGDDWENQNTAIHYKYFGDEAGDLAATGDTEEEKLSTKVKWIAFKQQFFSSALIANYFFSNAYIKYTKLKDDSVNLKLMTAKIRLPYNGEAKESLPLTFYFGPNQYKILSDINFKPDDPLELETLVPLGWGIFGWVNKWGIIPLFNFLGSFISSYGLIILLLTIIIKLVLAPLTLKSFLASAKMRVLKPQIDEIHGKIPKEKAMERQQATMALYKKVGVNPLGGCIPIALQFPILLAMFKFFPASIELRQQSFLWASDLSSYDSILNLPFTIPWYGDHISLFTLLMAGSIILSTMVNSAQMGDMNASMPGAKFMMWMMPVMMVFWFNGYSSGLSYYYFLSNMISFGQTILMRRFVNEEEILRKLNEQKKKVVKKSKFQERLEEVARQRGYKPPKK